MADVHAASLAGLGPSAQPSPRLGGLGTTSAPLKYRSDSLVSVASIASVASASVKSFHDDEPGARADERCGGLARLLAAAVVGHPWHVIAAWASVFVISCCFAPSLLEAVQASYDPEPGMPSFAARRAMDRHFPGAADRLVDSVLLSLEPHVDAFDALALPLQAADKLERSFEEIRRDFPGLLLETRSWRGGFGPGESAASYTSSDERQHLVQVVWDASGPDGRRRAAGAAAQLLLAARRLDLEFGPQGLGVVATGPHALQAAAQAQARQDIGVHAVMLLPFAILAMHSHLRRWSLLPLPALCSLFSFALAFALEYAVACRQAVDQNVPTLMAFLCVSLCIDWSFFLLSRFREEEEACGHEGAVVVALSRTGANVALSGCLIVVCSSCMLLMPPAIASNAVGGALAVLAALSCCLTLLPACLAASPSLFARGADQSLVAAAPPAEHQTLWYLWAGLVTRFPVNLAVLLLLIAALGPLVVRLGSSVPAVGTGMGLPPKDPAVVALAQLREAFGGGPRGEAEMYVVGEAGPRCPAGVKSDGHFDASCRVARAILGLDGSGDVVSVASYRPSRAETLRCLQWRTHFASEAAAQAAAVGNATPSGHLLLTGQTRHLYLFAPGQLSSLRQLYSRLWSRCVSEDNMASLIAIRLSWDTITWKGFSFVEDLRLLLASSAEQGSVEADPCAGLRFMEFSETSVWYDYVMTSVRVLPWAIALACLVTTLSVAAYFRSALAPLKLLLTVVLPLAWVYGAAVLCFEDGLLDGLGADSPLHSSGGLHWMVPCSTSMLLLSLAVDYNVFYFGRAAEFRSAGFSDVDALRQGLASTGPVITRAGLIFALEFAGLLFSEAPLNRQGGFVVVAGVLLDTFVVRSCLAPAVLSLKAEWNWWPARMPQALPEAGDETSRVLELEEESPASAFAEGL